MESISLSFVLYKEKTFSIWGFRVLDRGFTWVNYVASQPNFLTKLIFFSILPSTSTSLGSWSVGSSFTTILLISLSSHHYHPITLQPPSSLLPHYHYYHNYHYFT
jgi:hypothetical protein